MIWIIIALFNPWVGPAQGDLVLQVDNIQQASGKLWIGIYSSPGNFLVKEKARIFSFSVRATGSEKLRLPALPHGTYAIALFHDINGNDRLDQNWIGIPTEPYAFSGTVKSKWRLPRFEEVNFVFRRKKQHLAIRLARWQD